MHLLSTSVGTKPQPLHTLYIAIIHMDTKLAHRRKTSNACYSARNKHPHAHTNAMYVRVRE